MIGKLLLLTCLLLTGATYFVSGQVEKAKTDSVKIKTGWNFGAIPTITFDTDQGFQYGAAVNFYNFGDGSAFPRYNHSLYF